MRLISLYKRLVIALDCNLLKAIFIVRALHAAGIYCLFKIGFADLARIMANITNPEVMAQYVELMTLIGKDYLLDIKLNDIPNTIERAMKELQVAPPEWVNLHCSVGEEAFAIAIANRGKIKVAGVSILTSFNDEGCTTVFGKKVSEKVVEFARMLLRVGAQGIICSAPDLEILNQYPEFAKLEKITPGIQEKSVKTDQKRVMTAAEAIELESTRIVVGRQIVNADDPVVAAMAVIKEIEKGLNQRKASLQEKIFKILIDLDIVKKGHYVLASLLHSGLYADKSIVYLNPSDVSKIAYEIAKLYVHDDVGLVVGPELGGVVLANWVAYHLSQLTGKKVQSLFAEKVRTVEEGKIVVNEFTLKRGLKEAIGDNPNVRVLICEDIITTAKTVKDVLKAVEKIIPAEQIVGVVNLLNRGGKTAKDIGVDDLTSLVEVKFESFTAENCQLCKDKVPVNRLLGRGKEFLDSPEGQAIYGDSTIPETQQM